MRFLVVTKYTVYMGMGDASYTEAKPFSTAEAARDYQRRVLEKKVYHIKNPDTSEVYVKY